MTTLREETIKGIQAEEAFDMSEYGEYSELSKACGTACCIAGHIVAATARLRRSLPAVSEVALFTDRGFNPKARQLLEEKGLKDDHNETARAARLIWARTYGVEEANRLDFEDWGTYTRLYDITAGLAVRHLNGEDSVALADEAGINERW